MKEILLNQTVLLITAGICCFCAAVSSLCMIWSNWRSNRAQQAAGERAIEWEDNENDFTEILLVPDESDMAMVLRSLAAVDKEDAEKPETAMDIET